MRLQARVTGGVGKVYVRVEMPGLGILLQHDASRRCWLAAPEGRPYQVLTRDDDSRRVLGAVLVPRKIS